jgi:hypothetical protein
MEVYFVLDENGAPREEPDVEKWQQWFDQADCGVARTAVSPEVMVLTTFRGYDDLAAPDATPKLFETRVFGGVLDGEEVAHASRAQALAAHAGLIEWCRAGIAEAIAADQDAGVLD